MKAKLKITALLAATALVTSGVAWAVPVVYNVEMTQLPETRMVQVTYNLTNENAIVTLSIETNGVPIPDSAVTRLTGDVNKVVVAGEDSKSIMWNAGADWPEQLVTNARAQVTAWVANAPPQVMVIDLSKGTSATALNPYPVFYYNSLAAMPNGGLSNAMYKTDMLVMNKIPSGGYAMGDESTLGASVAVTLTQAFYAGVYQVTQKQWYKVMGEDPSEFKNPSGPVEKITYDSIRGTQAQSDGGWPTSNSVYAESFMGRLQSKTGLTGFDLPTDAQWEYACRAGTTTYYNDGISGSASSQLDDLGWWSGNSGPSTHTVGQKTPNQWGLYDMHGNVWEWCLDWAGPLVGGVDPRGASSATGRMMRGGSRTDAASRCRSADRYGNLAPNSRGNSVGFRLVKTLP